MKEIILDFGKTNKFQNVNDIVKNYTYMGQRIELLPKEMETFSQRRSSKSAREIKDEKHIIVATITFRNLIPYACYTRKLK